MIPEAYRKSARHKLLWATMCFLADVDRTSTVCVGKRDLEVFKAAAKGSLLRRQTIFEHKAAERFKTYFREEQAQVVKWVEAGKRGTLNKVLAPLQMDLLDAMTEVYMETGIRAGSYMNAHLPTAKAKPERDPFSQPMEAFLREQAAKNITNITDATAEKIRIILQRAVADGLTLQAQADQIDDLYLEDIIPNRSMTIARTETVNAANFASHFAATSAGVPMDKEWATMDDEYVRDDHATADGQVVGQDEPFVVGGEQLMWPGDGSRGASPENIINCRCTMLWHVAD